LLPVPHVGSKVAATVGTDTEHFGTFFAAVALINRIHGQQISTAVFAAKVRHKIRLSRPHGSTRIDEVAICHLCSYLKYSTVFATQGGKKLSFWDRMEEVVNQGLESSREILGKAKGKAKDLGEMGLLRYEIGQLERQAEKKFSQLGAKVYEKLVLKEQATVGKEAVKEFIDDIQELKDRLERLERDLKKVGK